MSVIVVHLYNVAKFEPRASDNNSSEKVAKVDYQETLASNNARQLPYIIITAGTGGTKLVNSSESRTEAGQEYSHTIDETSPML